MRLAALYIAVIYAASPGFSNAEDVTWAYSGTVTTFSNNFGMPTPVSQPVKISITFDPDTVVIHSSILLGGRYLMSGGNTSVNVQIGEHVSDPINKFRMDAVPKNCCAAVDGYRFLSDTPGTRMVINFPGFVEDGTLAFEFTDRFIPGPLTSNELPLVQPNPVDFLVARMAIVKFEGGNLVFFLNSSDLQIAVPEPTSFMLVAVGTVCGLAMCYRK